MSMLQVEKRLDVSDYPLTSAHRRGCYFSRFIIFSIFKGLKRIQVSVFTVEEKKEAEYSHRSTDRADVFVRFF